MLGCACTLDKDISNSTESRKKCVTGGFVRPEMLSLWSTISNNICYKLQKCCDKPVQWMPTRTSTFNVYNTFYNCVHVVTKKNQIGV